MSDPLRLVPLGGLGEIGMNCMAFEHGEDVLVVDCGVMFPDRELGVDVIHPDLGWLLERRDRVRGVVLTHGHEDHIGGLPYLLRDLDVPVHGPPYALALVKERLGEHDLPRPPRLSPTEPGRRLRVGAFEVEPIRVTHSIADCTALVLRSPAGTVVHTGDFKLDGSIEGGESFDAERLQAVGDEGVDLLLSDSTNAWVAGESGEEATVARTLDALVARAEARVVVSIFASNVHRLRALMAVARAHDRRVCLLGRSVQRHVRVAVETGHLPDPGSLLISSDAAADLPRGELLVIATGTQGERLAALSRLATGRHHSLSLEEGDEVVLSSRIIPGHEQAVFGMINDLERRGIRVRFRATDPGVHVSGHAHRDEQRRMIELVRPRAFLPVHGTLLHLKRHAELARELGVTDTLVVENGAVVEVAASGLRVVNRAQTGRVHVDAGEEIPQEVLRDRALMAELGFALVVVPVDSGGRLAGPPDVLTRGVVAEEDEQELAAAAGRHVAESIGRGKAQPGEQDEAELRDRAQRALKRFLGRRLGRKPLTWAVVVRVPR